MILYRYIFFLAPLLATSTSFSQKTYNDSLKVYQHQYKADLVSVIKSDTAFVKFFDINPDYRVIASVEKLQGENFFSMPTSGKSKDAVKYALITFTLNGKEYKLYAYRLAMLMTNPKYKDDLFIPFTDLTSGNETYGGGRYMDFTIADIDKDGKLKIDFNRAYNPYCAFATGYNCPIPPKENDLQVKINAGEMNFGKKNH